MPNNTPGRTETLLENARKPIYIIITIEMTYNKKKKMMIMYNIYFFLFKVLMVLKTHNHNNILFLFRTIFHFKAKKYIS